MNIKTNAPSALDTVIRILSMNGVACTKRNNNEIMVEGRDEAEMRVLLQEKLDAEKFDFVNDRVLVAGNTVWSFDKITKELAKMKKKGVTDGVTKYMYSFMHMNLTGTMCNLKGWVEAYPTWDAVKTIVANAECADWKTDVIRILEQARKL